MSEIPVILFRLSVSLIALAAKANQDGMVQQQIETMGLRQWLSLVSAWLVERTYMEIAALHDFSEAVFPQRLVKIAAPTTLFIFLRSASRAREKVAQYVRFVVLNHTYEIEFNLLNPYLIVPASRRFMFDHDGKRVSQKDTAKSS